MIEKKINTALCSFGMSGVVFHAPFLHLHDGFNFYGVLERSKNLAKEKYPYVKTFRTLDELLNDDEIELVVVNTPNATHFEYTKKALLAGKHVIVEKPFTVEIAEGEELIELAATQKKMLSVYHNRRWDSDYKTVRNIVKANLLGDIVEAEIHYDRFKEELSPKLHKETPGPGTGVLYDLGSHLIDQALQLFGTPEAVFADILALRPISKVEDYFELLLYYPNLRVRLKATYVAKETVAATVIHGTKGSFLKPKADVQEDMLQAGEIPSGINWGVEAEEGKGLLHIAKDGVEVREYIKSEKGNYMDYYDGIYEAIRNNKQVPITAEDGLMVIKIIKAAMQSNEEKKGDYIMKHFKFILIFCFLLNAYFISAQQNYISKVWVADNGNGTYKNPVLHADYSDPDVIRVGDDYFMVSSSFEDVPGLPILHSKDLVNWSILTYALKRQPPFDHYSIPQHGAGVWAPSIRYYKNEFYIYYPDPDFGIYLIKAKNAAGPWSDPILVEGGKGLIDPCPLWDDDGQVYLVYAYAGSRAGIKSILAVKKLNKEGTKTMDEGVLVYDGHETDATIEGPKFYKRNGYYYIFAPAGGVSTGWQLVLRSKNIYGPYERKIVMEQGKTNINGPHQGAWVTTQKGEDWFLHFQDKEAYGRVVHLNPMKWINDWPVIGLDTDADGKGEPVSTYKKPNIGKVYLIQTPVETDEFNSNTLGLQWQWVSNPKATWSFMYPSKGVLRLYADKIPDSAKNLWDVPNVLQQKFPSEEFMVTTKLSFTPNTKLVNEETGVAIMGLSYAGITLKSTKDGGVNLIHITCKDAGKGKAEVEKLIMKFTSADVYFRVKVTKGGKCNFSYSIDGQKFINVGEEFTAEPGRWKGAKFGIFCTRETTTNDSGYADFDWVRVERVD